MKYEILWYPVSRRKARGYSWKRTSWTPRDHLSCWLRYDSRSEGTSPRETISGTYTDLQPCACSRIEVTRSSASPTPWPPIDSSAARPVSYTHLTLPTNREV